MVRVLPVIVRGFFLHPLRQRDNLFLPIALSYRLVTILTLPIFVSVELTGRRFLCNRLRYLLPRRTLRLAHSVLFNLIDHSQLPLFILGLVSLMHLRLHRFIVNLLSLPFRSVLVIGTFFRTLSLIGSFYIPQSPLLSGLGFSLFWLLRRRTVLRIVTILMINSISLNINGLNGLLKRTALVDWLKCMNADIVCLQETRAVSHEVIRGWFRNSGFTVASSCLSSRRCGTAILVRDSYNISKIVRDDGGRFLQVEIDIERTKLRFVSLYAPNTNLARNRFFAQVSELIDLAVPTFLCGDFNSVLDPTLDRKRDPSYAGSIHRPAAESVAALQSLLSSTETFPVWRKRHPGQTTYSWDHGWDLFSSRIDMIWDPLMLERSISACGYFPSFLSDHRYMLLRFSVTEAFERGPGVWKFNASHLNNTDYCQLVTSFWQFWKTLEGSDWCGSDTDWWDSGKFYLRIITQWFGSRLKATDGKHKRDLSRRLNELQRQFDDGDQSVFSTLCEVQEELRSFCLADARASQVRARCHWAEEFETSSKFFLSLEKKHKASQSVHSIRNPGTGHVHHDPFFILSTWQTYCSNLFSAETCDLVEQAILLSTVTRKLTPAVAQSCEGLLTPAECHSALLGMSPGKTPGSDGFPMEFDVRFWDVLGDDLVRVLNSAYDAGELPTSQRRGLIIVLY